MLGKFSGEKNYFFGKHFWGEKNPFFGKYHSKDTIEKIKIARSRQFGEKNPFYGRKHTEESLKKIKLFQKGQISWNKGKKGIMPEPWNKGKPFLAMEQNPNWNGGTSFLPYPPMFNGRLKQFIKERDKNRCSNPNCEGRHFLLMPHHINYDKNDCRPVNLITLCKVCNSKANIGREKWEKIYHGIVSCRSTEHFTRFSNQSSLEASR